MGWIIALLLILALFFGPQLWAQAVFRHYSKERPDIPGSGGELAQHLIELFKLDAEIKVDRLSRDDIGGEGSGGDHYDTRGKRVRLAGDNFDGRSLTAIAIAAHEVGHALQHAANERMFLWRGRLIIFAQFAQKAGAMLMVALPFVGLITRVPQSSGFMFLVGLISFGLATLVHLVTLPVEIDASFGKALPILERGEYVKKQDIPAIRRILRAAAMTYFAASLASLLNIWRWFRLLRGRPL